MIVKYAEKLPRPVQILLLVLLPFAAAGALLAVKTLYARFVMPYMPPCLLRTFTGLRCPSCGMTHSVFALCRLDVSEAARENLMIPLFVLTVLPAGYIELWRKVLGRPKKIIPRSGIFWLGAAVFWLAYTVLRNIFGW